MIYSPLEFFKNSVSFVLTKCFYPSARLIRYPVYVRGRKKMSFQKGFTTGYRCRFEMLGAENDITLKIGKNCKIGDHVHMVASQSVEIGDDCLVASHVFVSDTDHGGENEHPMIPPDSRPLICNPVSIGKCVMLGEGVCVLSGAKIGDGCIIGAHAVVKGEIPAYTVAVGAPAKPIKKYNFQNKCWERYSYE